MKGWQESIGGGNRIFAHSCHNNAKYFRFFDFLD